MILVEMDLSGVSPVPVDAFKAAISEPPCVHIFLFHVRGTEKHHFAYIRQA